MIEEKEEFSKSELESILEEKLVELKEVEQIGKGDNYFKILSDIALIQLQLELYDESEKNYLLCLKYFQLQKDRLGQASVYGLLGTLFLKKNEFKNAIENYKKSNEINVQLNQVAEPLIKYICENFHPYVGVHVDCGGLQVLEHLFRLKNEKFILD